MNILNIDIKKTKSFKKIMISICSMIMVFSSCFAPYSKVKALVGIDDVALSYVALSVLGLCGITLAGTTLSNTDITKLGSDVAGSISRTFDTLGKTVSDKWNLLVQTAGATGKIALDYVNDLKGNIQDWWNGMSSVPSITPVNAAINSFLGVSSVNVYYTIWSKNYVNNGIVEHYGVSSLVPSAGTFGKDLDNVLYIGGGNLYGIRSDYIIPVFCNFNDGLIKVAFFSTAIISNPSSYISNLKRQDSDYFIYDYFTNVEGVTNKITDGSISFNFGDFSTFGLYTTYPVLVYNYLTNSLGLMKCNYGSGAMTTSYSMPYVGTLDLDGFGKKDDDLTGSFKLDDRVLGATGALALTDKIIGAVGSLDLDLTNDVVNSYGYVDVPSTTLDYPYTGTWDSTLDGIGAIAWAPTLDVPVADTNVIAPTLPGTTDTDIPKVKDFTGEGSQLSFDWKGVFPFCIPFDLIKFIQCFCADPEAPKFEIPVNIPKIYEGNIKVDLSDFDDVAALCRTLFDILFIIGLAYATRYLIKG